MAGDPGGVTPPGSLAPWPATAARSADLAGYIEGVLLGEQPADGMHDAVTALPDHPGREAVGVGDEHRRCPADLLLQLPQPGRDRYRQDRCRIAEQPDLLGQAGRQ